MVHRYDNGRAGRGEAPMVNAGTLPDESDLQRAQGPSAEYANWQL